jgi:hydroxymethylpyrimidine/phosphomethylpyrimidine kinase
MALRGRVLIVAGSDSGGGAGIQADIKTVSALGGYAMTAITALTAQNTLGVAGVHAVPPDFVALQMTAVLSDLGADAVKTGMLLDPAIVHAVCDVLEAQTPHLALVADPVMIAKGGSALLQEEALDAFRTRLMKLAALLTPNLPEAETLCGFEVADEGQMHRAADALLRMGVPAVLIKGGHLPGEDLVDLLATPRETLAFRGRRLPGRHTHGTGCTLASGIATGLAQGMGLADAVGRARDFVRAAIASAPGFGAGHGPLDHSVRL